MAIATLKERILRVKTLAAQPLSEVREKKRVEIIMLKFKEDPQVIDRAINRIVHHTHYPFKLTIFDNRPLPGEENNRNTARIWNKLINDATCRYVLIIDSDAFVPMDLSPCWLSRMMESINQTGFVIPVSSAPGGANQYVDGPLPYPSSDRNKGVWSGFCFLFDREGEYQNVGNFDERFYIYGQDSEFAYRVGKRGGAVMRSDVFVEHIGGYSFKQDPDREDDKLYARRLFEFLTKEK